MLGKNTVAMRTVHLVALATLTALALAGSALGQASLQVGVEARASADTTLPAEAPRPDDLSAPTSLEHLPAPTPLDPDMLDQLGALEGFGVERMDLGTAGFSADTQLEATSRTQSSDAGEALVDAVLDQVPPAVADAAPAVVATAGFLALLQAFGAWRILGLGAFAMYSRLTKSELLDNEHRDKVFQLIRERPGIGATEIQNATGLGWGTTVYHLDRLERAQMVTSERSGLHRCYFPVGTIARDDRKAYGLLKGDTTKSIANFLIQRPGATQSELCEALGMSASAASKQLTRLEGAGLVRREREWKTVRLFPEGALPGLVQPREHAAVALPLAA